MPLTPQIHCGTSGWSYAHWNGIVYPSFKARAFHPLEYLAEYFDAAEIHNSFHGPLRPELARLWVKKVSANSDFQFTARLQRAFTHERLVTAVGLAEYKEGLAPLRRSGKLGCLLMQFPSSFRYTPENRAYFIALRRSFHDFPLVAELRHNSWMVDEALGTLIDYKVGFCNIDQPQSSRAMPPTAFLTSGIGYVRLHGRNSRDWLNDFTPGTGSPTEEPYLYAEPLLTEWKSRIEQIRKHATRTFVIANNDGAGMAAVNALQLQAMLGGCTKAPPALINAYPEELAGFTANQPVQRKLFASEGPGRRVA